MGFPEQHPQSRPPWRGAWWLGGVIGTGIWLLGALAFGASSESRYDALISSIAPQYGLEPTLVKAVIKCESGFNPLAVSPRGAQGLMQLMPTTQALLGVTDAFAPQESIGAGARYLAMLQQLFPGNVALMVAAYNAGPQAVLAAGAAVPAYPETQRFVQCVLAAWQRYQQQDGTAVWSALPASGTHVVPGQTLHVQPLRLSRPAVRVGQPLTVSVEAVQAGPQTAHGVVLLMYPESLVSYVMLHTTGNETTVRLPESSPGQMRSASWGTPAYQVLRGDWPAWQPGQRRTMALALQPRVPQDITVHLSIFLDQTTLPTQQQRWSTIVRLPVRAQPG